MAASEMAQQIKKTVDDEGYYDMEAASEAVDRYCLQEVREVLDDLIRQHDTGCASPPNCVVLQRARKLAHRLLVKEG